MTRSELPLDPDLAAILLDFICEAEREALAKLGDEGTGIIESDLLFGSPVKGRHFHASPIGQDYIRPAGCCLVDCPNCGAIAGEWCKTDFPVPNGKRLPLHDERLDAAGKYGGIVGKPFGIPTGPGWMTPEHRWECSRSSCCMDRVKNHLDRPSATRGNAASTNLLPSLDLMPCWTLITHSCHV